MHVYRYSEELQKQLGSKTKPEPWLHATYAINPDKKGGKYVIFVWDTRQVVEEGKLSRAQLFDKYGNRYSTSHFVLRGRPARDNGQPLKGAKSEWTFDETDAPLILNIKKVKQTGKQYVYDTDSRGIWDFAMQINGHNVVVTMGAPRFGVVDRTGGKSHMQYLSCEVDGEGVDMFKLGTGIGGFHGSTMSVSIPAPAPVGKSQHFVGQRYKMPNFSKEVVAEMQRMAANSPELFSAAFKRAIA